MSKKTVVTIGVVLIILQIASFSGMSKTLVGLYPNYDDLMFGTNSVEQSELNAKKSLFAISAGIERFFIGLEDVFYEEYEYRALSPKQITSAMIRSSLGSSGFDLAVYDTILTISYSLAGILGVGLLLSGKKEKTK